MWFKQATAYSAVISGSLPKENALHTATRSGIEDFKKSIDWSNSFKQQHSAVYKTVVVECKSVESSNNE
jgi:hypothetical protein